MADQGRCDWCGKPAPFRKQRRGYENATTFGGQFLEACAKHQTQLEDACNSSPNELGGNPQMPTPDLLSLFDSTQGD